MYEHLTVEIEATSGNFALQLTRAHDKHAVDGWELVTVTALPPLATNGCYLNLVNYPSNNVEAKNAVKIRNRITFLVTYRREK